MGEVFRLRRIYLSIKTKYVLAWAFASIWLLVSIFLSKSWFDDFSQVVGAGIAFYLIGFIAIIPGFMNAYLVAGLLLDLRPKIRSSDQFPPVTILVAAYNEADNIEDTLLGLARQDYQGRMRIIVIDDGSSDGTAAIVENHQAEIPHLQLISHPHNQGKSSALNTGLHYAKDDIIITVDADCVVKINGVSNLVGRYLSDPPDTKAVAGEVLIRNSRQNWITKAQEWDYFLGIAAVKRIQSLFHGTLVAQGAFSLYDRATVLHLGGWPQTVGEDIVLTWKLLAAGFRVGHAENACAFTQCPDTLRQFIRQRQRWSRGLIEAFKASPQALFKARLSTIYIWWNLLFPMMDVAYTIGFLPGIVVACFGYFWIVGPMTLALLPIALLMNQIMLSASAKMFKEEGLVIRSNRTGLIVYMLIYSLILQPACVLGYVSELLNIRKHWGTK